MKMIEYYYRQVLKEEIIQERKKLQQYVEDACKEIKEKIEKEIQKKYDKNDIRLIEMLYQIQR